MKKSMKKFMVACAAVSAITVAAGMSAMAAEYSAETNTATYTVPAAKADTQMTILVIAQDKAAAPADADILYINQDAVGGAVNGTAALKAVEGGLADGTYLVKVGYYDEAGTFNIADDTFTIGDTPIQETHDVLIGDVVGTDGAINSTDAQQILRYTVKGTASFASDKDKLIAANVTKNDTEINSTDAQQVLRYSVKGSTSTNVGKIAKVDADYNVVEIVDAQ